MDMTPTQKERSLIWDSAHKIRATLTDADRAQIERNDQVYGKGLGFVRFVLEKRDADEAR